MPHHEIDLNALAPEVMPSLSETFFNDRSLLQDYDAYRPDWSGGTGGDQVLPDPFQPTDTAGDCCPMLNATIKEQLAGADNLTISSAEENRANGVEPDYRLIAGESGELILEKIGDGDPLEDGELNIEMDTLGKSVEESIKESDRVLKEYYRELIAQWVKEHPGKDYPSWWDDIINSEPAIPDQARPVPIRPAPQAAPTPERPEVLPPQLTPHTAPSRGGGAGGGGGGFSGGGPGFGGGDGRGAGYDSGGRYRSGDGSDRAHSGAVPNTDKQSLLDNVNTVVDVAEEVGVDPKLAVAVMLVESGGDNRAVGDNGTSFGLFQLHEGGMLTSAGLTPEQAYDPEINARVSLGNLAKIVDRYSNPGEAAAASQRPADPVGYARKVNNSMDEAAELIQQAEAQEQQERASGRVTIEDGRWLSPEAADAFEGAQREARANGSEIQVTSAGRTHEEQTALWNNRHNNPYPVARPGTSKHESGNAIDISNYNDPVVRTALHNHGFVADVPGDPIHFEFRGHA